MAEQADTRAWTSSYPSLVTSDEICHISRELLIHFERGEWGDWISDHHGYDHVASFKHLDASAADGCRVCQIFRRAWLDEDIKLSGWNEDWCIEYNKFRDQGEEWAGFLVTPRWSNIGGFEGYHSLMCHRSRNDNLEFGRQRFAELRRIPQSPDRLLVNWDGRCYVHTSSLHGCHPKVQGRPVGNNADFSLASQWIHDCSSEHTRCGAIQPRPLPSRVVDVGDQLNEPKLVETEGQHGTYLTLSHCWGGSTPVITDKDNYATHLRAIIFSALPKTFQDAVLVTRELGYRYLWIDCLCIIQGDGGDWEMQYPQMDQIYENSALTIAGPGSTSPFDGFLHAKEEPSIAPFIFPSIQEGVYDDIAISLPGGIVGSYGLQPEPSSVLVTRGWVVQERLLSPRVLYFGSKQMYFECRTHLQYEAFWHPLIDGFNTDILGMVKSHHDFSDPATRRRVWGDVIKTYSRCELTHATDKFPALAGLAKRHAMDSHGEYVAGLWRRTLAEDLLWRSASSESRPPDVKTMCRGNVRYSDYIPPSWSWASVNGEILSAANSGQGNDPADPSRNVAKILSVKFELATQDPFGQLLSGSLVIEGKVRILPVHRPKRVYWGPTESARFFPDEGRAALADNSKKEPGQGPNEKVVEDGENVLVICLLIQCGEWVNSGWAGLALTCVGGAVYRRIGLVERDSRVDQVDCPYEPSEWTGVERRVVTII